MLTLATTKSKLLVIFQKIELVKSKDCFLTQEIVFEIKRLVLISRDWFWYQEINSCIQKTWKSFGMSLVLRISITTKEWKVRWYSYASFSIQYVHEIVQDVFNFDKFLTQTCKNLMVETPENWNWWHFFQFMKNL